MPGTQSIAALLMRFVGGAPLLLMPTLLTAEDGETLSLARRIAEFTQEFAQGVGREFGEIAALFEGVGTEAIGPHLLKVGLELSDLGIIIAVTIGLILLSRPAARPFFERAERWAQRGDDRLRSVRRGVGVLGAALVDITTILIAWLTGYAVALFLLGEFGAIEIHISLFLNALVLVEGFKALLRLFFAPRNDHLRLLPLGSKDASHWNRHLARLTGLIGYGLLFAVPLLNRHLSEGSGQLATLLIMVAAFAYVVTVSFRSRDQVREGLVARAVKSEVVFTRTALSMLAWTWHWLVIGYFGALTFITITQPESALPFMTQATVQSVGAVAVGAFLSLFLSQATARKIRLSDERRRHYPLLEQRLNAYLPFILKSVRALILVTIIGLVLDAWGLFAFTAWLTSESGRFFVSALFSVGVILVASMAAWLLAASWIEHRLNPDFGKQPTAREQTLLTLFRNAIAVTLVTLTAMIVLAEIGINIGPLIAGAGVLGLAIGFGAQKLVQDIITGVFIQLENAIDVGDIITAAGITGTVEKLTVRSVNIRDLHGTYHFVPFSSVDSISNFTRHFAYHVGDYGVAYRENIDEVAPHLEAAYESLKSDPSVAGALRGEFSIDGISSLADSAVNIRVRIKTAPGMQWAVGRAYNGWVKKHLDAAGIEIPYPHRTLYFGEDRNGSAPPLRIAHLQGASTPSASS